MLGRSTVRVRRTPTEAAARLRTEAAEVGAGTWRKSSGPKPSTSAHAVMALLSLPPAATCQCHRWARLLQQQNLHSRAPCCTAVAAEELSWCLLQRQLVTVSALQLLALIDADPDCMALPKTTCIPACRQPLFSQG